MADATARQIADALRIADAAVIADIETCAVRIGKARDRIWDVRPMLDSREHADPVIDMAREALRYARDRGLVRYVLPSQPWLVQIV